jgi:transposase
VLEAAGLDVRMVNGRQTRNAPGRKTDMHDAQWGSTLHMHGLLRAGFVPTADIRRLQDYLRLRSDHVCQAASCVQLMQKALERMNIKFHDAISDLTGVSGMAVMRAIVAGERNPAALLALCDVQIRRAKAELVTESLRGTWSEEHVFALEQALQSWDHYQRLIIDCDRRIQSVLPPHDPTQPKLPKTVKRGGTNAPHIDMLREILAQMCGGRDLTMIPAHTQYSALQLIGETGTDLSKWPTEKHFTSWTGLAPGNHDSGKRKGRVKRTRNRAGKLFCIMATSLVRSKHIALGAFYRRLAMRRYEGARSQARRLVLARHGQGRRLCRKRHRPLRGAGPQTKGTRSASSGQRTWSPARPTTGLKLPMQAFNKIKSLSYGSWRAHS